MPEQAFHPSDLPHVFAEWKNVPEQTLTYTSFIDKFLICWKPSQLILAEYTIDASIISARMEILCFPGFFQACRSIHAARFFWSMESTWPFNLRYWEKYSSDGVSLKKKHYLFHCIWYKLLGDGKMCQNKLFHSIEFVTNLRRMEENAGTSFFNPSNL